MNKEIKKILKTIMSLIIILMIILTPIISNAAYLKQDSTDSKFILMLQRANKKYKDVKNYKGYLEKMTESTKKIDTKKSVNETKIEIIDTATKLRKDYNETTIISRISNQIINTTINSNATTTTGLVESLVNTIKQLLKNTNLAIQSLEPNVTIDNMIAITAGERCGEDYKVNLKGKIYYAEIDKDGNPTSNKWVYLINGSNMNGQAMADSVGQMYLEQGYNILAPDSRGYGDSEGSVAMGYVESLDVWDWLTYLNNTYGDKCKKIILHGISLGGATTVFASGLEINGKTMKDQNVIGLVEDCGYTSLTGIIKGMLGSSSSSSDDSSNELVAKILGIFEKDNLSSLSMDSLTDSLIKKILIENVGVGLTEENFDKYQNALDSLNRCELPILIIHGTKDTTVPYDNSTEIYNTAMANEKIPYVQRFIAEEEQHAFIVLGTKYNVYEGHVENFVKSAEKIADGQNVSKESDYEEKEEEKTSAMTSLIKALKLVKNIVKL